MSLWKKTPRHWRPLWEFMVLSDDSSGDAPSLHLADSRLDLALAATMETPEVEQMLGACPWEEVPLPPRGPHAVPPVFRQKAQPLRHG